MQFEEASLIDLILDFLSAEGQFDTADALFDQLDLLTTCRGGFFRLPRILRYIIQSACRLALRAVAFNFDNNKNKLVSKCSCDEFSQSCLAFAFILIPSLPELVDQIKFYTLVGQVCQCSIVELNEKAWTYAQFIFPFF